MRKNRPNTQTIILTLVVIAVGMYLVPQIRERVNWRVEQLRMQLMSIIRPPEKVVFIPQQEKTQSTALVIQTATTLPTIIQTSVPAANSITPTVDPATLPTALPPFVEIKGVRYITQHGYPNSCAPSTLGMALSFWDWRGSREDIGKAVKPYRDDYNVMPYEMENYTKNNAGLQSIIRMGGNSALLKTLIAGGFPVLLEMGVYQLDLANNVSWMGHYILVTGYDEAKGEFIVQDAYKGPNQRFAYPALENEWRSFNFLFMVVYTPEKEQHLMDLLGLYKDEEAANRIAYDRATAEISKFTDINQYFAWFNRGTSMVKLKDFTGAAQAYDQSFAIYQTLPEDTRPFRMVWYQTGPYYAYYYTSRFQDLINLADKTLSIANHLGLEESNYWRAMGYAATGKNAEAIADLNTSLKIHPGFEPSVQLLQQLGDK
ncbi:MAG: C39 family peptidase [Leptolinea sp.]